MKSRRAPKNDRQSQETRWLIGLRGQARSLVGLAVAAPLLSGALLVLQAWLLARLLDDAIARGVPAAELFPQVLLLAALIGLRALLAFCGEQAGIAAAETIKQQVREALFARLLSERPDWTAARASGALVSTIMDQVESLDGFFARFFPAMIQATVLPLAFALLVLPVDWVAGLLFLFTAPAIPLFMALIGWGAEAASRAQADAYNRLSARFADRLRGLLTLRLFGRADAEIAEMGAAGEQLRTRTLRVLRIAFLSSAALEFFAALGVGGVALYIGLSYLGYIDLRSAPLTLQGGLFCLLMAPEIYQPLRLLAANYHDRAHAKAATSAIADIFGALPAGSPAPVVVSKPVPAAAGPVTVETRALSIETPDRSRMVIAGLDLLVPAGAHVAIFGDSGIGKSTLIETLGALRAFQGEILLNGVPIADIPEEVLRQRIALIGQRPRIFHASIAENIRLGAPGCSDEALHAAARLACVDEFTAAMPDGLDTMLGEGGHGVSGGEAHRIALARLYVRDPGLILLDEPTAHLDTATEARVLDGLLAFAKGRTLICATHSPALVERMDRAFRLTAAGLLPVSGDSEARVASLEGVI